MSSTAVAPMNICSNNPRVTAVHRHAPKPSTAMTPTAPRPAATAPRSTPVSTVPSKTGATGPMAKQATTTTTTTTTRAYPAITIAKKPPTMTTSTPSTATAGRVSLSPMAAPSSHAAAAAAAMVPGGSKKKKEGSGVTTEVPIFLQSKLSQAVTTAALLMYFPSSGLAIVTLVCWKVVSIWHVGIDITVRCDRIFGYLRS